MLSDHARFEPGFDIACRKDAVDVAGNEQPPAIPMPVQRAQADMVARCKCGAVLGIPDQEDEFTVDMIAALLLPGLPGAEHQFGVGAIAQVQPACFQLGAQFVRIGQSAIYYQMNAPGLIRQRLVFLQRFRGGVEHAVAQRRAFAGPVAGAIRAAIGHGIGHAPDHVGLDGPAIDSQHCCNSAHRVSRRWCIAANLCQPRAVLASQGLTLLRDSRDSAGYAQGPTRAR